MNTADQALLWEIRNELSDIIATFHGCGVAEIHAELATALDKVDDKLLMFLEEQTK